MVDAAVARNEVVEPSSLMTTEMNFCLIDNESDTDSLRFINYYWRKKMALS